MIKIKCSTFFDITATGVTGHYKSGRHPYLDLASWNRARNQQRNWETIMQIISLRAQPTIVAYPEQKSQTWEFVFEVETPGVYSANGTIDNYDTLLSECQGIPMIVGLTENSALQSQLSATVEPVNIWFKSVNK